MSADLAAGLLRERIERMGCQRIGERIERMGCQRIAGTDGTDGLSTDCGNGWNGFRR